MRAQASLEYLLTYSLAFFILISAIGILIENRPSISPPDQCEVSGPFRCVEFAQNSGSLLVLFQPTTDRDLIVGNATLRFRDTWSQDAGGSSDYCDVSNVNSGATSTSSLTVGNQQRFEANCSIASLYAGGDISGPLEFLEEREEMTLRVEYQEQGLTFQKSAETQILI